MSDKDYGIWMETEEIGTAEWVAWVSIAAAVAVGLGLPLLIWFLVG